MMSVSLLYSPFPSAESAKETAIRLLEEKLVGCCNVLPATEALYMWEGALTNATEYILLAKTTPAMAQAAQDRIAALHPYSCPAILHLAAEANATYTGWLESCVAPA